MAAINYWHLAGKQAGTNFQAMQQDGAAPATAAYTAATGWIMSSTSSGNTDEFFSQTERAANTFGADSTSLPGAPNNTNGNGFVIPTALTGTFEAGQWQFNFNSRSITAVWTNGVVAFKVGVYRSSAQTGTSPTLIGNTTPFVTPDSPAHALVNTLYLTTGLYDLPEFELNNEFLIFTVACKVVTAATGSGTTRDVNFAISNSAVFLTTNFTASTLSTINKTRTTSQPIALY